MGKFHIGDRVRVREDLEEGFYGGLTFASEMKKFRGKIFKIKEYDELDNSYRVNGNGYWWSDEMLERVEYTYEDLCKAPIGTQITFKKGEVLTKTNLHIGGWNNNVWRDSNSARNNKDLKGFKDNYGDLGKIIKIEEPTSYTTVYGAKTGILDEKEKKYLGNVIKPFRDSIMYITKASDGNEEFIKIALTYDDINFPNFAKSAMYKGMEVDKEYTLEELGI